MMEKGLWNTAATSAHPSKSEFWEERSAKRVKRGQGWVGGGKDEVELPCRGHWGESWPWRECVKRKVNLEGTAVAATAATPKQQHWTIQTHIRHQLPMPDISIRPCSEGAKAVHPQSTNHCQAKKHIELSLNNIPLLKTIADLITFKHKNGRRTNLTGWLYISNALQTFANREHLKMSWKHFSCVKLFFTFSSNTLTLSTVIMHDVMFILPITFLLLVWQTDWTMIVGLHPKSFPISC